MAESSGWNGEASIPFNRSHMVDATLEYKDSGLRQWEGVGPQQFNVVADFPNPYSYIDEMNPPTHESTSGVLRWDAMRGCIRQYSLTQRFSSFLPNASRWAVTTAVKVVPVR